EAECLAAGGQPKGPGSCMPDPCADSAQGAFVACCENDDDETECEVRTATACSERGGIATGSTCDPDPCTPAGGDAVRCCLSDEHHDGHHDGRVRDHGRDGGD